MRTGSKAQNTLGDGKMRNLTMMTDLYQLTMMYGYYKLA